MDYTALDKSLQRQVISPVYLFYGEETYMRDFYLNRFKLLIPEEYRDFNLDILDGRETGIETIVNIAGTLPFLSDKRLVIVKNADFFKARRKGQGKNTGKSEEGTGNGDKVPDTDNSEESGEDRSGEDSGMKVLEAYLADPSISTCLIFCSDSVDKKRRIYKNIEKCGQVVQFSSLRNRELNQWIDSRARKLGMIIEPQASAGLIAAVGNNLRQLSSELKKLACYTSGAKITASDVKLMVSRTAELNIFDLVDAVGGRDYKTAVRMAREMVSGGEPVIRLLYMTARQFRLIIKAKSILDEGCPEKQAAGQMQVHPYVAQKCIKQARNYSLDELKRCMEKILSTDADIKTGRQEPVLALELLIIHLCEKG